MRMKTNTGLGTSSLRAAAALLAATALLTGCATTSNRDQMQNTIYQTYSLVRKLDTELSSTVSELGVSSADLSARVDSSEQNLRELQGMAEENQRKLQGIQQQLETLQRNLSRQLGSGAAAAPSAGTASPGALEASAADGASAPAAASAGDVSSESAAQLYNQAQRSFINQDWESARAQYEEYLSRFPQTDLAENAQYWLALSYAKLAEIRQDLGLYQQSVQSFEQLRSAYPSSSKVPTSLYDQAEVHLQLQQRDRAIALLRQIVDEYPMAPTAVRAKSKLQELGG
mgnify:CR=1 FL=1